MILTTFNLDVTKLSVHWEVLEVHWARSGDGQSAMETIQICLKTDQSSEHSTYLRRELSTARLYHQGCPL